MMALGLGVVLTLSQSAILLTPAWSETTLEGSVTRSDEKNHPSVNMDDLKEIEAGTDLQMTVSTALSTSGSVSGDEFFAKITKDYKVDGKVVIPKGTLVHGMVEDAAGPKRAGRNAWIQTRFDYMITPDGREIPIEGDFSNRDSKLKAAAKVVGRSTGFTLAGGVVGALMVVKYGGIAAVVASEGYAVAGGAAVGGTAGLVTSLLTKGKHKMIQPGMELSFRLEEPIVLPSMNIPDVEDSNFAPEGLVVEVLGMRTGKDPFGEMTELQLTLDMINETQETFTFFDIGLQDENGTIFYPSAFGDTSLWFQKFYPNSRMVGNISFSVDNPRLQHHLVFFKRYTREPIAKFALVDNMVVDSKTAKNRLKQALQESATYRAKTSSSGI